MRLSRACAIIEHVAGRDTNKMTKEIGARVRVRRSEWGYTQQELADMTGIERSKITKIETGARGVETDEALAIARALDTSVEELFAEPTPVRYRLDGTTADGGEADDWFDRRIEYSLLVRSLGNLRAGQS